MLKYLKEVLFILGGDRKKLPLLFLFFLFLSLVDLLGLGLIGPYVSIIVDPDALDGSLGEIVQYFGLPSQKQDLLTSIGVILLVVFVLKTTFAIFVNKKIIDFGQGQQVRLRKLLMSSFQSLSYVEYLKRNSSEYIYSIQQLSQQFGLSVLLPILRIISDSIVGIVILSFLAWQSFSALALLVSLLGLMVFIYDSLIKKNMKRYGENANKASTLMLQGVQEGLEGFKEIRILGKEKHFYKQVANSATEFSYYSIKSQLLAITPRYLLELSLIIFIVLLVSLTLISGGNFEALIPTVAMFGVAALRLLPSANLLSSGLVQLRFSRDAVSRLYRDVKSTSNTNFKLISDLSNSTQPTFKSLTLKSVSFSYPNTNKKVLDRISLEINSGESIGFIGTSGSGKTTLIDIILGLLNPQEGIIKLNDSLLKNSLNVWRSQLAYLPQQVFLLDNTLSQNIALGIDPDKINYDRLLSAINKAKLSGLVDELKDGVDTLIGERGMRLSGGQRQRIALARAFYHERDILVMDESTSALDSETEEEIVEEIKRLKGEKTLLVIAHRLTTLKHCDKIYELGNGKIIKSGSYLDVVKNHSSS
ncbi:ABC transporter ATP-binding protein/permease [Candidatus Thioglobus sp.]|nr:ABC transporter ATP-binding protein/permease [Candidatus Thioglobus sp.]